ncbi:MAG: hypothetical protein ACXADF_02500 [Candidatus Thorarchaeota archaeon]
MNETKKTTLLYIATMTNDILALIAFLAWHNLVSGTLPLGLCTECH